MSIHPIYIRPGVQAFDLNGYTWIMANNICTAANGVYMKKMLDPKDKSSLGKFGLSRGSPSRPHSHRALSSAHGPGFIRASTLLPRPRPHLTHATL